MQQRTDQHRLEGGGPRLGKNAPGDAGKRPCCPLRAKTASPPTSPRASQVTGQQQTQGACLHGGEQLAPESLVIRTCLACRKARPERDDPSQSNRTAFRNKTDPCRDTGTGTVKLTPSTWMSSWAACKATGRDKTHREGVHGSARARQRLESAGRTSETGTGYRDCIAQTARDTETMKPGQWRLQTSTGPGGGEDARP